MLAGSGRPGSGQICHTEEASWLQVPGRYTCGSAGWGSPSCQGGQWTATYRRLRARPAGAG